MTALRLLSIVGFSLTLMQSLCAFYGIVTTGRI